jgi:hypothetical protein
MASIKSPNGEPQRGVKQNQKRKEKIAPLGKNRFSFSDSLDLMTAT